MQLSKSIAFIFASFARSVSTAGCASSTDGDDASDETSNPTDETSNTEPEEPEATGEAREALTGCGASVSSTTQPGPSGMTMYKVYYKNCYATARLKAVINYYPDGFCLTVPRGQGVLLATYFWPGSFGYVKRC